MQLKNSNWPILNANLMINIYRRNKEQTMDDLNPGMELCPKHS